MALSTLKEVKHPCAWKRSDLLARDNWIHIIRETEANEINTALSIARSQGVTPETVNPENFPLFQLKQTLNTISEELENGLGIALIRGINVDAYSRSDMDLLYAGIGSYLGTAVPQSRNGELIGLVTDTGKKLGEVRGTKTREMLPFHNDRSDVVGLLCLKKAKTGGESYVVSAAAIYNAMLHVHPDLCEALFEPYHHRRTDWEAQYAEDVYALPILSFKDGKFAARYLRYFINSAQELPTTSRISERQLNAINKLEEYFQDEEYFVSLPFEVGDIQFLNNFVAFHSRAGYEDFEEEFKRRLLLRLWLSVPNSRALIDDFSAIYGQTGAGQLRGGVQIEKNERQSV
jgi:Taurine catabolism dioxygenase TauD, TfdA family